jgi:hypothetical protein
MDVAQAFVSASPAHSGPALLGISLGQWIAIGVPIGAQIGVLLSLWNARVVARQQLDHAARDRQTSHGLVHSPSRLQEQNNADAVQSSCCQALARETSLFFDHQIQRHSIDPATGRSSSAVT